MAEKEAAPKASLFKWLLGAAGGIVSGVVLMYVTGFVNTVVKPPKPLPNFEVDLMDGLNVRFQNLASYHIQGWWDFGDGSSLVPVTEEPIVHTFPRPGTYTVKMTLQNLLGEEGERAVPITLTAQPTSAAASPIEGPPRILELKATNINAFAPATVRVTGKVENAKLCVWSLDDKLHMTTEGKNEIDRTVMIERPGEHSITLAAFDGSQDEPKAEQRVKVVVQPPPAGAIMAILKVSGSGTHLHTSEQKRTLSALFPADKKDNTVEFNIHTLAQPGCTLLGARVETPDGKGPQVSKTNKEIPLEPPAIKGGSVRDLRLALDEKHAQVRLMGKLTRSEAAAKGKEPAPFVSIPVVLLQQHRSQARFAPQASTMPLVVPSKGQPTSARLKLPPTEGMDIERKLSLELKDGEHTLALWPDLQQSVSRVLAIQNRICNVTVSPVKDAVEVTLQAN